MEVLEYLKTIEAKDFSDEDGECKLKMGANASDEEILKAEENLNVKLPYDYKSFLKEYGNANFFGAQFLSPNGLYRFDEDTLEMEGFIPFAQDIMGNYFVFDKSLKIASSFWKKIFNFSLHFSNSIHLKSECSSLIFISPPFGLHKKINIVITCPSALVKCLTLIG